MCQVDLEDLTNITQNNSSVIILTNIAYEQLQEQKC